GPLILRDASRGTMFVDEAGRLLGTMRANKYGEGLKDLLSRLWDCPESHQRTLSQRKFEVASVYVNLLGTTTVSRFTELMTPEDVQSGFLARFLPVVAKGPLDYKPLSKATPAVSAMGDELIRQLYALHETMVKLPEGALDSGR